MTELFFSFCEMRTGTHLLAQLKQERFSFCSVIGFPV